MSTPPLTNSPSPINTAEKRPLSRKPVSISIRGIGDSNSSFGPSENSTKDSVDIKKVTTPKAITIPIEVKDSAGTKTETVDLDYALKKKLIAPQEAFEKGYCSESYLIARGYGSVQIQCTSFSYEGSLRTALKNRYITIEQAIEQGHITKEQAIEGGALND